MYRNCQNCDTAQRANCSEVRGELEFGTIIHEEVIKPIPMPLTLRVIVLDRFEYEAISEPDSNTLYLLRG